VNRTTAGDVELPEVESDRELGRILIVDDDRMNRMLLSRTLERDGHTTASAESGEQALKMLGQAPYDVVLLDVVMPEMDGFEVLARVKGDPQTRHLPVIMISAVDDMAEIVQGIQNGAEDYLPKPFDAVLLSARIRASLARKRLHDLEMQYRAEIREHALTLEQLNRELTRRVQEQVDELNRLNRLRRFLSPQLAELVVSAGEESLLEPHRREISVLFCDLQGFTSFSEISAPEQVVSVLGEFHENFGALVRAFNATVGFFAGDGLMVFFNDPIPCPDPAARAMRMATALRTSMAGTLAGWRRREYDLDFRTGIAFGYATLGQMGFEGRNDYTAVGPVVNMAARLCDLGFGGGDILADQASYSAVEHLVHAEPLGLVNLKGFSRPRSVYRILEMHDETVPTE